jgi:transcriptional regulator with XRE-family HTH domain
MTTTAPAPAQPTPLAALMRERGVSAFELAEQLTQLLRGPFIEPKTIQRYARGSLTPSRDRQLLIAQLLTVDVDDVFPAGARLRRAA